MNRKGFTLIELVMVIVLIGILAVAVAPRLGKVSSANASAFAGKLRADIRYAQDLAMTQNRRYRVYFNTNPPAPAQGYAVVYDTSGGAWSSFGYAQDPASGGNLSIILNAGQYAGITVASTVNPVEFNSLGKPSGGLTTVTVSPGNYQITIAAQTGVVN
jgi:prepilin-type N-terminal cleavage/methylation domain-containing protein